MTDLRKALIYNISGLGDIVSSTLLAEHLKANNIKVYFYTDRDKASLFKGDKDINIISGKELSTERFDLVIDITSTRHTAKQIKKINAYVIIGRYRTMLQKFIRRIHYDVVLPKKMHNNIVKDYYPIVDYLDPVRRNNYGRPFLYPYIDEEIKSFAEKCRKNSRRIITIHIGAGNEKRMLPKQLIVDISMFCKMKNYSAILVGDETGRAKEIVQKTGNHAIYKKTSLAQLKTLLLLSDLFIGSDSGILHIASALGVPSIGLFGPNPASICAPVSDNIRVIEDNSLECRPCRQIRQCRNAMKCQRPFTLENVIRHMSDLLDRYGDALSYSLLFPEITQVLCC